LSHDEGNEYTCAIYDNPKIAQDLPKHDELPICACRKAAWCLVEYFIQPEASHDSPGKEKWQECKPDAHQTNLGEAFE